MTPPNKTERRLIVDTHRHPMGPKMQAKRKLACTTRNKDSRRPTLRT
jgi:hypothetical protein